MDSQPETRSAGAPEGNRNAAKPEAKTERFPSPRHTKAALDRAAALAKSEDVTLSEWLRIAVDEKLERDDPRVSSPLLD